MRLPVLFLLTAALLAPSAALAAIDQITTLTGRTYRHCEIVRVHPDGVSFTHAKGAAKVLFVDLPESWRKRLGYEPAKAAAYEREIAEKRQRQAEARAAYQQELARGLARAQELELARLRATEEQARLAVRAIESANPFGSAYQYPLLPPLGAVFDSRDYRYARRGYHGYGWPFHPPYGNGLWYGLSSGYYHLNGRLSSPGWSVHPPPPPRFGVGVSRGNFTFQINP